MEADVPMNPPIPPRIAPGDAPPRLTSREFALLMIAALAVGAFAALLAVKHGGGHASPVASTVPVDISRRYSLRPVPEPVHLAKVSLKQFDRDLLPGELDRISLEVSWIKPADAEIRNRATISWKLQGPDEKAPSAAGEVPLEAGPVGLAQSVAQAFEKTAGGPALPATLSVVVALGPGKGGAPEPTSGPAKIRIGLPAGLTYPAADPARPGESFPVLRDDHYRPVFTCRREVDGALVSLFYDQVSGTFRIVDKGLVTVSQYLDKFLIPANEARLAPIRREIARQPIKFPFMFRTFEGLSNLNDAEEIRDASMFAERLGWPFTHDRSPQPGHEGCRVYPYAPFFQDRFNLAVKLTEMPDGKTTDAMPVTSICGHDAKLYLDWVREESGQPAWSLCDRSRQDALAGRLVPPDPDRRAPWPSADRRLGLDNRGVHYAVGNLIELGEPADGEVSTFGSDWRGRAIPSKIPATLRLTNAGFRLSMTVPPLGDASAEEPARTTAKLERKARP